MLNAAYIVLIAALTGPTGDTDNWPQFRGPDGNGHTAATGLPLQWSEQKNVVWKTAVHGVGWSSPVIWGDQIWMTTADKKGRNLHAVCVDRVSGKIVHDVKLFDVKKAERINRMNSYASPTPIIEAGRVYAHFGRYGTACLDTKTARVIWSRQDMQCEHHMGPGASPIPYGKNLIIAVDGVDVQYVTALDRQTGKTVWKTNRSLDYSNVHKYCRKAFCTPSVLDVAGRKQLVSPCARGIVAYDPDSGAELWKVRTKGFSGVPRPVSDDKKVYAITDCDFPELWAIKADGKGDVTGSRIAWKLKKHMPQRASMMLIKDLMFTVSHKGDVVCIDTAKGKPVWEKRIGRAYSASPIYAENRVYLLSERSGTTVIEPSRKYKPLATNKLDGRVMATPAVAGKAMFIRTDTHLYRIEKGD